ncbi:short-chain dehydrogenase/reductase [Chaetomium strumarium]|uniref:Short-chain dehydrogenase/reductase n=1 Tax=Chaetomium strumarium TaxID=1170767 RepID=A0AAJ0M2B1_9PEZI|nr:short-chain dehydrogenase/reductase [Chaetomium strumarium]
MTDSNNSTTTTTTNNNNNNNNTITARETPGGPPPGLGTLGKLRWGAKHPPADPTVSFAGKTVLVTGANTGLGFEAAVKYARLGASRLILGVRSADKGEAAKQRIVQLSGRRDDDFFITVLLVDMAHFDSVRAFVQALGRATPRLDVALLNAGLANPSFQQSAAGWEMALQVNVLSTALMAVLLLPLLRATAAAETGTPPPTPPHLTFVNSFGHMLAEREWLGPSGSLLELANNREGWDPRKSYATVKLQGMAVMQAVARATTTTTTTSSAEQQQQQQQPEVIVNAVCPSQCKTDLGRQYGLMSKILMAPYQALFARTAEQGARSLVSATALGPESHGRFWHHDILHPIGDLAKDETLMRKAWDEIFQVVVVAQPDLQQILAGQGPQS